MRFRLSLTRFDYKITHVPGKLLYTADTLSRAPVTPAKELDKREERETELFAQTVISYLPADEDRLDVYRKAQQEDATCSQLITFVTQGWPARHRIKGNLIRYWTERGEISVHKDLLLYGSRLLVPQRLRRETLQKIHRGHQGIRKCRHRVLSAVWWAAVTREVEDFVKACPDLASVTGPPSAIENRKRRACANKADNWERKLT